MAETAKAPNPYGVSDKIAKSFTTKQMVVTYRMISHDSVNPLTGKPVIPPTEILPADYIFYDEYEEDINKRHKLIENITATLPKKLMDERTVMANKTAEVVFANGFFTVDTIRQRALFIWLELHPNNGSNKFRPNDAPIIFQRETVEKEVKDTISDQYLSAQAIVLLSRMTTAEKINILEANKTGSTANKDSSDIDLDILVLANKNPHVIVKNIQDIKVKTKALLSHARTMGVLLMDQATGAVKLRDSEEELLNIAGKPDAGTEILNFFMDKKNKKHLEKLEKEVTHDPFAIEIE